MRRGPAWPQKIESDGAKSAPVLSAIAAVGVVRATSSVPFVLASGPEPEMVRPSEACTIA